MNATTPAKPENTKPVRYSFLEDFKRTEKNFEHDYDGFPKKFFNADLRGKLVGAELELTPEILETIRTVDVHPDVLSTPIEQLPAADQLKVRLHRLRYLFVSRFDPRKLFLRLANSVSAPADMALSDEKVVELAEKLGVEDMALVGGSRDAGALKATRLWIGTVNGEQVAIADANQGAKNLQRYSMRGFEAEVKGSFRILDVRLLAGATRIRRATGTNLITESCDSKLPYEHRSAARWNALAALVSLEDSQLEGKNFMAQKSHIREHSSKIATAWMDKKNPDEIHVELMASSPLLEDFRKLEVDNDVASEELKSFEEDFAATKALLPQIPEDRKPELKIRKLGKHRAVGLFFPTLNILAVDVRDSSSFIHEYGHALDFMVYGGASLSAEFRPISRAYAAALPSSVGTKASYYNTPTEQFARLFEIYSVEVLGLANRLVNASNFSQPDYAPYMENEELKAQGFDFLNSLFRGEIR